MSIEMNTPSDGFLTLKFPDCPVITIAPDSSITIAGAISLPPSSLSLSSSSSSTEAQATGSKQRGQKNKVAPKKIDYPHAEEESKLKMLPPLFTCPKKQEKMLPAIVDTDASSVSGGSVPDCCCDRP